MKHLVDEADFLNNTIHKTKVFVFGINDIIKGESKNNRSDIIYTSYSGSLLYSVADYVSSLYLNPFFGREIFID